jgi:hypothetical protein
MICGILDMAKFQDQMPICTITTQNQVCREIINHKKITKKQQSWKRLKIRKKIESLEV